MNNSTTLSNQAYDLIEEMIVTLKLKPGSVIAEADLMREIKIGRTPIREALLRLASEHLVETLPRKGIIVSEIHITDHLALLETRRALERIIVAKATRRATAEQRKTLSEFAALIESAAEQKNLNSFIHIDHEFDHILGEACRNPFAAEACSPLRAHCRRFWYRFHHDEDLSESAKLHAAIMRAIADNDELKAVAGSDDLMDYLERLTREAIDK
ncbi:GntR family transcriptional regulator [bacterium]|nr:MAG: GntR family transcriptional regulator [bacterium]